MNKISRPLLATLLVLLMFALVAAVITAGPYSSGDGPMIMFFGEDLSDSPLGWLIAIPILVLVGIVVMAILAGAALVAMLAMAFAAIVVLLAMLLAMTPFAIFLALPILAVYGFIKLVQRDRQQSGAMA